MKRRKNTFGDFTDTNLRRRWFILPGRLVWLSLIDKLTNTHTYTYMDTVYFAPFSEDFPQTKKIAGNWMKMEWMNEWMNQWMGLPNKMIRHMAIDSVWNWMIQFNSLVLSDRRSKESNKQVKLFHQPTMHVAFMCILNERISSRFTTDLVVNHADL